MKKSPSFLEQYDKLTVAYLEGRIRSLQPSNCFIGILLDGNEDWALKRLYSKQTNSYYSSDPESIDLVYGFYTSAELFRLEQNFITKIVVLDPDCWHVTDQSLFDGLESTLHILQGIHEAKEVILQRA